MQDAIAGVTISSQYKPQIDVNEFPVVDTRPMTDMVNEGFVVNGTVKTNRSV